MNEIFKRLNITEDIIALADKTEQACKKYFDNIDKIKEQNQLKVLGAFMNQNVAPAHFAPSYGYGYDDMGREKLAQLFCEIFKAQAGIVRPQIASGTHALALALQGITKKGSRILSASGAPYDTLEDIIGADKPIEGSLIDMGASYSVLDLKDKHIDFDLLADASANADIVMLQRSRGYQDRPSLRICDIEKACRIIKNSNPEAVIFVDNCYGEFVEEREPLEVGADIIVGSLIKNAGGGIAPTGAYILGRADLIERISYRMTAPGIGGEVGSYAGGYLPFYQGIFLAPQSVSEALKGAVFAAKLLEKFEPSPAFDEERGCIIQSLHLKNEQNIIDFCRCLQQCSPVDSFVAPEPWAMPGYSDRVIMAAGTFIQGASIELSGDAPIREPYVFYMQGGIVYSQVKLAAMYAYSKMEDNL